ncbi:MAG: methyltransferase domain-containing protein [Myxococcota bacterium]
MAATLLAGACNRGGPGSGPPQHYDDPKAMIAIFEDEERDGWQQPEQVVRVLNLISKNAVIADIGAGSGYFTRRLAAEVPEGRVYAVDVDGEFEDYLLEHREAWGTPNIEPHLAIYDDPMLPQGELDVVFTANTYAYIRNRVGYFGKIRAALKADGRLAIIEFRPQAEAPEGTAPDPQHRVSRDTAVTELQQAGFEVEREETFLPHQWFLVLKPAP